MLQIIGKIFIMFLLTIALMRIMGKSSIVQLTPYDLVAIFIIGTIVTEPLVTSDFIPAIIRVLIVVAFYLVFAKLTLNQSMNEFLLGQPSILIKHGKIVEDNLEKEHISLIQLLSILRNAGYSKLTEVDFAILEPTGSISVIPVPSSRPVTLSDLNIEAQYEGLPIALIIDGKIQKHNLKLIEQNEPWLKEQIIEKGIDDINDIIYAFVDDQSEEIYVSLRDDVESDVNDENSDKTSRSPNFKVDREFCLIKNSIIQIDKLKKAGISKTNLEEILEINNFKQIKKVLLKQIFIVEKEDK